MMETTSTKFANRDNINMPAPRSAPSEFLPKLPNLTPIIYDEIRAWLANYTLI